MSVIQKSFETNVSSAEDFQSFMAVLGKNFSCKQVLGKIIKSVLGKIFVVVCTVVLGLNSFVSCKFCKRFSKFN